MELKVVGLVLLGLTRLSVSEEAACVEMFIDTICNSFTAAESKLCIQPRRPYEMRCERVCLSVSGVTCSYWLVNGDPPPVHDLTETICINSNEIADQEILVLCQNDENPVTVRIKAPCSEDQSCAPVMPTNANPDAMVTISYWGEPPLGTVTTVDDDATTSTIAESSPTMSSSIEPSLTQSAPPLPSSTLSTAAITPVGPSSPMESEAGIPINIPEWLKYVIPLLCFFVVGAVIVCLWQRRRRRRAGGNGGGNPPHRDVEMVVRGHGGGGGDGDNDPPNPDGDPPNPEGHEMGTEIQHNGHLRRQGLVEEQCNGEQHQTNGSSHLQNEDLVQRCLTRMRLSVLDLDAILPYTYAVQCTVESTFSFLHKAHHTVDQATRIRLEEVCDVPLSKCEEKWQAQPEEEEHRKPEEDNLVNGHEGYEAERQEATTTEVKKCISTRPRGSLKSSRFRLVDTKLLQLSGVRVVTIHDSSWKVFKLNTEEMDPEELVNNYIPDISPPVG